MRQLRVRNLLRAVGVCLLATVAGAQTAEQKVHASLWQAAKSNPAAMVEVDVKAGASRALYASIVQLGGGIVKFDADGKGMRVRLPYSAMAALAARPEVQRIDPVGGVQGGGGMVVFVDPATGRQRTPSAAEMNSLTAGAKASAPVTGPRFRYGPGAQVEMILGPEDMVYSVASVGSDGKLKTDCVQGETSAKKSAKAKDAGKGKAADAKH